MSQGVAAGRIGTERIVVEAHRLAEREHAGQARKANGDPYIEHALSVAEILADAGFDSEVIAAALLHDTVEHTDVSAEGIARSFGERIAELVSAMTDRDGIESWEERKAEHRARVERTGRDACAIYAADKLCGIREAREGYDEVGERVEERLGNSLDLRIAVWRDDIAMVDGLRPPLPFAEDLRGELSCLLDDRSEAVLRSTDASAPAG